MRLTTLGGCALALATSVTPLGTAHAERAHAAVTVTATVASRCEILANEELDGFLRLTCAQVPTREVRVVTTDARVMVEIQF
jgi:hypothetical protein